MGEISLHFQIYYCFRDMSLDVQSCYSSNPSQPLLCRDQVIFLFQLTSYGNDDFVKYQVAQFSQCVLDWRNQALKSA